MTVRIFKDNRRRRYLRRGCATEYHFPADSPALIFRYAFGKRGVCTNKDRDVGAERQAERRQFINGKPALPKDD